MVPVTVTSPRGTSASTVSTPGTSRSRAVTDRVACRHLMPSTRRSTRAGRTLSASPSPMPRCWRRPLSEACPLPPSRRYAPSVAPVELLRELVRIRSVNPPGDEDAVASLLNDYLTDAGLSTRILHSPGGGPIFSRVSRDARTVPRWCSCPTATWSRSRKARSTKDPSSAELAGSVVWGRGTLDMKGIAVMHAVAAAQLARSGRARWREVVVVVAADEESRGREGARWLTEEHAADRVRGRLPATGGPRRGRLWPDGRIPTLGRPDRGRRKRPPSGSTSSARGTPVMARSHLAGRLCAASPTPSVMSPGCANRASTP